MQRERLSFEVDKRYSFEETSKKKHYKITKTFTIKAVTISLKKNDFLIKPQILPNRPKKPNYQNLLPVKKIKSIFSFTNKSCWENSDFESPKTQIMEISEKISEKKFLDEKIKVSQKLLNGMIEKIFSNQDIILVNFSNLEKSHKMIFSFFLKKKFNIEIKEFLDQEVLIIPKKYKKTKRNEEIYKYGLKTYFKLYSKKKNKIDFQNNVTGIKQKFMLKILKEISDFLKIDFNEFLNYTFISKNDLMIKGIKRVNLYNKSETFKENIDYFYRNEFILHTKKIRLEKIKNLTNRLVGKIHLIEGDERKEEVLSMIFRNKRFKLPWTDNELINTQNFGFKYFCS